MHTKALICNSCNNLFVWFSAICKHYDGVILPEVKDHKRFNVNANVGFGTKAKNKFFRLFKARKEKESSAPSSEEQGLTDYKLLSHSHHVELRKNALTTYLGSLWDTLYGPESMGDPVNVVRTVHAIYATLDDSCVFFNWNQMDWKLSETTDVSCLN